MFKVFFNDVEVFNAQSLEDALALALNLHRLSQIEHTIGVFDVSDDKSVVSLKRAQ